MMPALIEGESGTAKMVDMVRGRLRHMIPLIKEALVGKLSGQHQFLLRALMHQLIYSEGQIERFDEQIKAAARPFEKTIAALIPTQSFDRVSAASDQDLSE
jgi:hypothetical protein